MTKELQAFRNILLREIKGSKEIMESYQGKGEQELAAFWDGAGVQAKEILDIFDYVFREEIFNEENVNSKGNC